jgi:hypothetical protein
MIDLAENAGAEVFLNKKMGCNLADATCVVGKKEEHGKTRNTIWFFVLMVFHRLL